MRRVKGMKDVVCVVLTGGPCGGKSSSLKCLKDVLEGKGYRVMTMPEVPTLLMSNGAHFPGEDFR
jgi:thymidylate kinase